MTTARLTVTVTTALILLLCSRGTAQQNLEIPRPIAGEQIIKRKAYTVSHNQLYNLANWVSYVLTRDETVPVVNRFEGVFKPDPELPFSPETSDYAQSGYDRGHLAPAADMEFDYSIMQESFYFSNIAPQDPAFNRGIWKRLECLQRLWAKDYDSIYIITGPVLRGKMRTIGYHNISVPRYFYKVIMRRDKNGKYVGAGFVFPNRDANSHLRDRMVSIDSVEAITGIDFFPALPDHIEAPMERVACRECWDWHKGNKWVEPADTRNDDHSKPNNGSSTQPGKTKPDGGRTTQPSGNSVQCKGKTQAGKRCSRRTTDPSGYCHQHKK